MIRQILIGSAILLGTLPLASAQGPSLQRPSRPSVSPYLNLLNPGGSLTSNYYNLYRPQRDFEQFQRQAGSAARQLRSELGSQQSELQELQRRNSQLSPSGTAASFMTHQRYFGNNGR